MLLMPKRSRIASAVAQKLMARAPEPKGYYEGSMSLGAPSDEEGMDDAAIKSAASAILRSVARNDVDGLAAALKDFMIICDEEESEGEYSSGGDVFDSPYSIGE